MNDKQEPNRNSNEKKLSRRQATKKLLASGGIVGAAAMNTDRWVKPVVNSTALPAHAGLSDDEYSG